MRISILFFALFITQLLFAQKKPLDHSVYDSWESIGEKMISNDGKWVVYTINVQEGDNQLVIQSSDAKYKKNIERGYNALITEDSRFVIFRIRPFFKDLKEARIKNLPAGRQGKTADDSPKDSLAIIKLGNDNTWKLQRVKGYKTPENSFGWVAYHQEKTIEAPAAKTKLPDTKKITDSLNRIIDSLQTVIETMPQPKKKKKSKDEEYDEGNEDFATRNPQLITHNSTDADGDETPAAPAETGTNLVLRKLETGEQKIFVNVLEYYFSKNGQKLLIEVSRNPKDSLSKPLVLLHDLRKGFADTLSWGGNEFKNFALTDDGSQVAYLAEREAKPKELQKFYKLWYFKEGMDSATLLVDKNAVGMKIGMTISEFGNLSFSKSGKRLFFGTAPIQPPKDTSLIDMDLAKLDIWHYNDDYLQTVQLFRLQRDLQENFLAVYLFDSNIVHQLGSKEIPTIYQTDEGDGEQFAGVTDFGRRIESQWAGNTKKDIYAINVNEGTKKLVKKDMLGIISPSYISPTGKYIMWYESKAKNYFVWDGNEIRNISSKINVPLWNEEHDSPSDPPPYGVMGWMENDNYILINDRYDIWKVDLLGNANPTSIFDSPGRKNKITYRYIKTDPNEKFIPDGKELLVRSFNNQTKYFGLSFLILGKPNLLLTNTPFEDQPHIYNIPLKAKDSLVYVYTKESFRESPDIYINRSFKEEQKLSSINPRQKDYNWGTTELFKWKTFKGKQSEGILYKPEDFDPNKKYPVLIYFYETLSDGLNNYIPPAPTGSRINISFFVSRGYIVFAPDIRYTIGHPAKSAYDYVRRH
jgi:hypothetical protein